MSVKIKKVLKRLLRVVLFIVVFIFATILMIKYLNPAIGRAPIAENIESPNFDGKLFINPVPTKSASFKNVPDIVKNYIFKKEEGSPTGNFDFTEKNRESLGNGKTHINWLGHAALLIEKNNQYILLDPMLGERASPFSFTGPKRYNPSPIAPEDLPDISVLILSHDHYDHMDYPTIKKIHQKVGIFLVPLGVGATLEHWGVPKAKIKEMDWHDSHTSDFCEITATPARHFSGRYLTQNNTLWASWVIKLGEEVIYFGGDSGIFDGFEAIGDQYGPFDLSLMPIGAYHEAWHDIHMNPKEAIDAFNQVKRGKFLPIHWGTFDLALHSWYDPIERLVESKDLSKEELITPLPGEWFEYNDYQSDHNWWKKYTKKYH